VAAPTTRRGGWQGRSSERRRHKLNEGGGAAGNDPVSICAGEVLRGVLMKRL
jgi:hypothetical protein